MSFESGNRLWFSWSKPSFIGEVVHSVFLTLPWNLSYKREESQVKPQSVLTLIVLLTLLPQYGTIEIRTEIRTPLLKIEAGFRQPLTVSSALNFVKITVSPHHLTLSRNPNLCFDIVREKCDLSIFMNFPRH
jgi:hypothetical protein